MHPWIAIISDGVAETEEMTKARIAEKKARKKKDFEGK